MDKELMDKELMDKELMDKKSVDSLSTLLEKSETLHFLLTSSKLTQDQAETNIKILEKFTTKVLKQRNGTDTDLHLWSLKVAAKSGDLEFDYPTHSNPISGKWMFSSLHYFNRSEPATNYSTIWVLTPVPGGGDILRPYTMPGLSATDIGANISLNKNGNIWNVTFEEVDTPYTIYTTSEASGYVGLYVKDSESGSDVYLMPHTTVTPDTTEQDIVGTTKENLSIVEVWKMEEVLPDYVFPVPEPPNSSCITPAHASCRSKF